MSSTSMAWSQYEKLKIHYIVNIMRLVAKNPIHFRKVIIVKDKVADIHYITSPSVWAI